MIFVRDKGRLCNNILQYGHVYAWGREHGRATVSMRFAYKYRYFHLCHTPCHNFMVYLMAKYGAKCGLLPVVSFNEEGADYSREEAQMQSLRHMVVEGWYARWHDLFLKYRNEITNLFAFDYSVKARPLRLLATLPASGIRLGLHIRRGDYRQFYGGRFCYSDEQYLDVVRQFVALMPGRQVQVVVCGNDPDLNRQAFHEALPGVDVLFPDGNPGEDLFTLSECHYLIGAPSTFSLVAAMYHDRPLYWIEQPDRPLTLDAFKRFDHLFRHIY